MKFFRKPSIVWKGHPRTYFTLLRSPNGDFLGAYEDGLASFDYVDDEAIWDSVAGADASRHLATGLAVKAESPHSQDGRYLRHQGMWLVGSRL